MDMPQRRISDTGVEGICGYGLQPSHDRTLAPIVVRQLGSGSVEVSQGYDRLAGVPPGVGIGVEPPVHPPDARHIRVGLSLRCRRVIPLAEERHRQAKRLLFSRPVPQRDDERSEVDLPGIRPPHDTYDRGIQFLQQGIRGFQTDRGVVVAGDDHDLQARVQAVRLPQETIETALRPRGRVRHVEHVAGDQQDIRLPLHQKICQKTEESLVLRLPVVAEKGLA